MGTVATVVSLLGMLVTQAPTFIALGVDLADAFAKGKALISSDTASTAEERAAALSDIEALELQRDTLLEELRQRAPDS